MGKPRAKALPPVRVLIRENQPTPAQAAAWRLLFAKLLAIENGKPPVDAPGAMEVETMELNSEIENNMLQERAQALLRFFPGRQDAYALQQKDGQYLCIRKPLKPQVIDAHCKGQLTVAVYPLTPQGRAKCGLVDIDDDTDRGREAALCVRRALAHFSIPSLLEPSGRKGYHLWVPFADFLPASKVRRLLLGILLSIPDEYQSTKVEVFPKQEAPVDLGNPIKLPWGQHRVTGRWTHFVGDDFQPLPNGGLPALLDIPLAKEEVVDNAISELPEPATPKGGKGGAGWVEELLTGVTKGHRDDAAVKLAGHFIRKGLPASEVEAILLAWNAWNSPPWGEDPSDKGTPKEWAKAKVASVVRREGAKGEEHTNGQKAPPEPYPATPWAALTDGHLPPIPWLVEGLLPEANSLIIGGYAAYGKSWLQLTMAASIASGRPWLDSFATRQGTVLYLDEENSEYELRRRLHRLTAGYGYDPSALPVFFLTGTGLRLPDRQAVERLELTIQQYQPKAVFIDTLIRILGYDENDASKVSLGFARLKDLMNRYGLSFVLADHHRKPQGFDAGPEMALRGSTDKTNFVDSILTLRRSKGSGQLTALHTKARFGPSMPTFGYAIEDIGTGTVLTCQVVAEEEERATLIDEAKDIILGQFASLDTKLTRDEVLASLESLVSARWGGEALHQLVTEGKLAKRGSRDRRKLYGLPLPQAEMENEK